MQYIFIAVLCQCWHKQVCRYVHRVSLGFNGNGIVLSDFWHTRDGEQISSPLTELLNGKYNAVLYDTI